jgi:hypothetical protein
MMSQLGIVGKIEPATPKISMVIDIQSYEYYIPNESLYVPMSMFRQIQISYFWQKIVYPMKIIVLSPCSNKSHSLQTNPILISH